MRHLLLSLLSLLSAWLLLPGPAAAADPKPLPYRMAKYQFAAPHGQYAPEGAPPRRVDWEYPIFAETGDPAVRMLNGWLRLRALELLLGTGGQSALAKEAPRLTDRQVIERAIHDRDFIDGELDEAVVTPSVALGIYRGFDSYIEWMGSTRPQHGLLRALYNLRSGHPQPVSELFKDDDDGVLTDLYEAQMHRDEHPCELRHFDWNDAMLVAPDALNFSYGANPAQLIECGDGVSIRGPRIRALLKSPHDLEPEWTLVEQQAAPASAPRGSAAR